MNISVNIYYFLCIYYLFANALFNMYNIQYLQIVVFVIFGVYSIKQTIAHDCKQYAGYW